MRRLPLERAILGALPVTILAVACSSSWSPGLRDVAHPVRALGFAALAALALAWALARPRQARLDGAVAVSGGLLLALAALSAGWSVEPRHTVARAAAFGLMLVAAAGLAAAIAGDEERARRFFWAILAGAVLVALVGLGIAVVSPHDSVQAATQTIGARYRGVGVNPNTVAMLYAAALPLAAALGIEASERRARATAAAAFLLLAGSIVASGSRGAAAAAVLGLLVYAGVSARALAPRAAVVGGAGAFALAAVLVTAVSAPLTAAEAARAKSYVRPTSAKYTPNDAEWVVRLEDELGGSSLAGTRRGVDTSGRIQAWRGALKQGARRPLLGYGFGTEERVFVDRYRDFEGGVPENSFIGLFLQLGAVGLALFLALLTALVGAGVRLVRAGRKIAAPSLAVLAVGIVLVLVQSYLYSVGNVATLAVWACAFLPAGGE